MSLSTRKPSYSQTEDYRLFCVDCKQNVGPLGLDEIYMVQDSLWALARMTPTGGMLCIGCLELRIGRRLVAGDFTDCPLNREPSMSQRLRQRQVAA